MIYNPKNYDSLLGLQGLSDNLLKNHFKLYEGYITNVNKIQETISAAIKENKLSSPEISELRRRFGWEWNGMKLHEYYFENMSKSPSLIMETKSAKMKIEANFATLENWEKDFRASGAMRGIGWVVLYHNPEDGSLFNTWVNEHDMGHLAGLKPLLVLDVFEHAYTLDYGIKKADYLEVFMKSIDWNMVEKRI
ncbi:MAG: superoxide dismutase [Candidatus Pacebacteria bacterium]|nr:superoxide dismutase [Candidatus Paceibacterota bacterium]